MPANNKCKILLVDDDEDLLTLLRLQLQSEGFNVTISLNADKIFHILKTNPPDIILMDITMRKVDGNTLCKLIKGDKVTRHIPVIMFSAILNIKEVAEQCGANDYISKPFEMNTIKEKLLRYIPNPSVD